jgi:hypothetical protein
VTVLSDGLLYGRGTLRWASTAGNGSLEGKAQVDDDEETSNDFHRLHTLAGWLF